VSAVTRYLNEEPDGDDGAPDTDDRDVTALIPAAVDEVLAAAESWLGWDGRPVYSDGNAWTPHKCLRRVTDHLLDHLAELECRLAGQPTVPDRWHGRRLTLDSDWARFTEADLDEATSRLTRLAACYRIRLGTLDPAALDAPGDGGAWTVRQIVHHVSNVVYYAHQLDRS
jgi:hypothetical protein